MSLSFIANLGIVDCKHDKLHVHVYHEGQGKKGGNNVASLIVKTLKMFDWIDKDFHLNIIFDNCPGQNKNNIVLRLVPYFVETGMFKKVDFIFLIVGHTKNNADRLFNTMKKRYRVSNVYTMNMLLTELRSENIIPIKVDDGDMRDYDKMLGNYYKRYPAIEEFHIFACLSADKGTRHFNVKITQADTPGAKSITFNAIKQGFKGRENYPRTKKGLIRAIANRKDSIRNDEPEIIPPPGINPYKQVELFTKYRDLLDEDSKDITCPRPSKEVWALVKDEKEMNKKRKLDKKKIQIELLEKMASL